MSDPRFALPHDVDERTLLATFLDFQRDALERKCADITDDDARRCPVPTSNLSLVGLVRHLASVERWYFSIVLAGADPATGLYDVGEDFADVADARIAEALAVWRSEVDAARAITTSVSLDASGSIPGQSDRVPVRVAARWVLVHMIDEYARHLGHADLLREAIDGRTGE